MDLLEHDPRYSVYRMWWYFKQAEGFPWLLEPKLFPLPSHDRTCCSIFSLEDQNKPYHVTDIFLPSWNSHGAPIVSMAFVSSHLFRWEDSHHFFKLITVYHWIQQWTDRLFIWDPLIPSSTRSWVGSDGVRVFSGPDTKAKLYGPCLIDRLCLGQIPLGL